MSDVENFNVKAMAKEGLLGAVRWELIYRVRASKRAIMEVERAADREFGLFT